jgi:hypothetical protein
MIAGQIPAKGWWGVEKKWSASLRSSSRTFWGSLEGEGMAGSGVPTTAEAAAERSSSVRRFLARKRAKLGLDSCSRGRESGWGGQIERRRGGGKGSTTAVAYRRGSSGGGPATGSGLGASVK